MHGGEGDRGSSEWVDGEAGPVVRSYALTGGMTRPSGEQIDLIDSVLAVGMARRHLQLGPEQTAVLRYCQSPVTLVELASGLNLAVGVVRILVSGLRDQGLVDVQRGRPAGGSELQVLRDIADGLRRL